MRNPLLGLCALSALCGSVPVARAEITACTDEMKLIFADDFTFAVVLEPSTLVLLAIVAPVLLQSVWRKRRRP